MDVPSYVVILMLGIVTLGFVFLAVYTINMRNSAKIIDAKRQDAERMLAEARKNADLLVQKALTEAKELALQEGRDFDKAQREKNSELQKAEKRVQKREETLEKRSQQLDKMEKELKKRSDQVDGEEKKAIEAVSNTEKTLKESQARLESIAQLTPEEARKHLLNALEHEVRSSAAAELKTIEEEARKTAEDRARSIISIAIQRVANEYVGDACVSVVSLPNDDMKGRIIGREGRNIRAIEQSTGVDLIIDDTPEAVILSCFNPVRREIAKVSIERLIADGRIHPARIEEVVQKVTSEFGQMIQEAGERSSFDCGIQGLHPDLITALGTLKYRTTGQQSVLQHSVETSIIAGAMAEELGINVRVAKRAGLLHDIGKSVDQDVEGHHALVGAQLAQKYGESPEVVEAIAKHHLEHLSNVSPVCVIVQAANVLSSFRPGARKDFLEKAIGRLKDIESVVTSFPGVEQAFVIRSGREIRAMVSPTVMNDEAVTLLAKSVAKKIRNDLNYPGQVKVTMVRETKVTQFAK